MLLNDWGYGHGERLQAGESEKGGMVVAEGEEPESTKDVGFCQAMFLDRLADRGEVDALSWTGCVEDQTEGFVTAGWNAVSIGEDKPRGMTCSAIHAVETDILTNAAPSMSMQTGEELESDADFDCRQARLTDWGFGGGDCRSLDALLGCSVIVSNLLDQEAIDSPR